MTQITILSPDMVAHIGGCADIKRRSRNRSVNVGAEAHANTYGTDSTSLLDALLLADVDLAGWFCEVAYQDNMTHWTVATCEIEPCLAKAIKRSDIRFDDRGRPFYMTVGPAEDVEVLIEADDYTGISFPVGIRQCSCGCGGFPKGKRSRFLPGHDAKLASSVKQTAQVAKITAVTPCGKLNGKWKCQRPTGHTGRHGTKVA